MKKILVFCIIMITVTSGVFAAEAGTGFSLYFPEAYYKDAGGTVSVENGFSTSFSFGKFLSLPIGMSYNKIQGYMVEGASVASTQPWFMGDSFLGYVMLKGTLPLGPLFFEAYGGGGVNWNASLTPFKGIIAEDLAGTSGDYAVITDLKYKNSFGFGWVAGGSFGFTISKMSVSVDFLYRDIKSALQMNGSYDIGPKGGSYATTALNEPDAMLVMRGFTIGLSGSFAF